MMMMIVGVMRLIAVALVVQLLSVECRVATVRWFDLLRSRDQQPSGRVANTTTLNKGQQ
jgi:hypothetical protein